MAGKAKAVGTAIKYGPIVIGLAQKYGPQVWDQVKTQRDPVEKLVQARVAKGNQRKKAMAHAVTVRDGSVLRVFHDNESHWVVFTADTPIAVYPPAQAGFEQLLEHADLVTRVRPGHGTGPLAHLQGRNPVPGLTARLSRRHTTPDAGEHASADHTSADHDGAEHDIEGPGAAEPGSDAAQRPTA